MMSVKTSPNQALQAHFAHADAAPRRSASKVSSSVYSLKLTRQQPSRRAAGGFPRRPAQLRHPVATARNAPWSVAADCVWCRRRRCGAFQHGDTAAQRLALQVMRGQQDGVASRLRRLMNSRASGAGRRQPRRSLVEHDNRRLVHQPAPPEAALHAADRLCVPLSRAG